ncbi:hypothetical protein U0070_006333, partial [Myodes glareolus]
SSTDFSLLQEERPVSGGDPEKLEAVEERRKSQERGAEQLAETRSRREEVLQKALEENKHLQQDGGGEADPKMEQIKENRKERHAAGVRRNKELQVETVWLKQW